MENLKHRDQDTGSVRRVKALYEAARGNDEETLAKLLVEQPVWNVCPGFPCGGVYRGMAEVFGSFFPRLLGRFHYFGAVPEVFIDGGDVVTVLGHYQFARKEGDPRTPVRFSHTWSIEAGGRIAGVWQVGDSARFIGSGDDDYL